MTREMNKPDWEQKKNHLLMAKMYHNWQEDLKEVKNVIKPRTLNPDVAEFVNELNERLNNVASK